MSFDPKFLAEAVVHWVEFENCCQRGGLISESSLSQPIGQLLNARSNNSVEPEHPHPILAEKAQGKPGRKPSVDFVIRTRNQSVITHAIETKFVTDKRDFKQEIFDDLVRLEMIHEPNRPMSRWILLAGLQSRLKVSIFESDGNAGPGNPRTLVFEPVFSLDPDIQLTVPIRDSILPQSRFWKKAGEGLSQLDTDLPISLTTKLVAAFPRNAQPDAYSCYIWSVGRVGRRSQFSFK